MADIPENNSFIKNQSIQQTLKYIDNAYIDLHKSLIIDDPTLIDEACKDLEAHTSRMRLEVSETARERG